jgi:ATP-dependent Clp protease ATP-binding subunit ClpA
MAQSFAESDFSRLYFMSNKAQDSSRQELVNTIYRAAGIAQEYGHEFVTLEHLLSALMEQAEVKDLLTILNVNQESISDALTTFFSSPFIEVTNTVPSPTKSFDEVITRCVGSALFSATPIATPTGLLIHLLQHPSDDSHAVTILLQHGLTALMLKKHLSHGTANVGAAQPGDMTGAPGAEQANPINTREDAEKLLDKYCVNLNKSALDSRIDPLIGRADEVGHIVQIVARRTKNNVVLVGEPGVGKTAIAEGLALKIVRKEVPTAIEDSTVYSLDIGNLVAGTRFRGDFEERMKQVLKALEFIPNAILFIDEIHTIMGAGAGSQGSLDVANLLKPALAKGTLRCIGSTTLEEYRKHFEKDRALLRRFKRVDVNEPSPEDSKLILRGLREVYEKFHGITFTDEALDKAVELTHRYVTNAYLPDKAIDVMDNAGARQRVAPEADRKLVLGVPEIEFEVSKVAKIPATEVQEDEAEKLGRLEIDLKSAVFGQDPAVTALVSAMFVARAGLREENKPSGSYLFTGPTGVGKTEVARQLAKTLGVPLLKYDMSEYMEKHSVAKLIGSPPGYVGYGEGGAGNGKLTNDVDSSPYCVLLLDEIEKAHPDVFNLLLQVMDDGRLTNSAGKSVSFRNVVLIMTSNAGAKEGQKKKIGFGSQDNSAASDTVVNDMFTPEFRNRLDATVRFDRLKPENITLVVEKFLNQLRDMASRRNVTIKVTDPAMKWLAEKGYDPDMGARPLARVINDNIKVPLSRLMVIGRLKDGGEAAVRLSDDTLIVE